MMRLVLPLSLAATLLLPDPELRAQELIRAGESAGGALLASDSTDAEGAFYDLYLVDTGEARRVVVTLESPEFDVFLEVGVLSDGIFRTFADQDDYPGLTSPTDARLVVALDSAIWGGGDLAVRVTSLEGGPDGTYRLQVESQPAPEPASTVLQLPERVSGSLTEDDEMWSPTFQDRYRFQLTEPRRVLLAMEADFDALLVLRKVEADSLVEVARDDDGLGGTNSFLEVDLREVGWYDVTATSYRQAVGPYLLEAWDAPLLVEESDPSAVNLAGTLPEGPGSTPELDQAALARAMGIEFTQAERDGLDMNAREVWNDAVGFRLPSPGADYLLAEQNVAEMFGTEEAPNVAAWALNDFEETSMVVILAIRTAVALNEGVFALLTQTLTAGLAPAEADAEIIPPTLDWPTRSYEWAGESGTFESGRTDFFCRASEAERVPGLIVCLLGTSQDGWSFMEAFRGLEIGDGG